MRYNRRVFVRMKPNAFPKRANDAFAFRSNRTCSTTRSWWSVFPKNTRVRNTTRVLYLLTRRSPCSHSMRNDKQDAPSTSVSTSLSCIRVPCKSRTGFRRVCDENVSATFGESVEFTTTPLFSGVRLNITNGGGGNFVKISSAVVFYRFRSVLAFGPHCWEWRKTIPRTPPPPQFWDPVRRGISVWNLET